ncbi:MAG TPA: hypothetical protein VNL74_09535 [Methylococcus sp.]|nr:hypothetical protein [Methylococcus sp.]
MPLVTGLVLSHACSGWLIVRAAELGPESAYRDLRDPQLAGLITWCWAALSLAPAPA